MYKNNFKNKNYFFKGFTLIELLIVISVIAVLSGVMLRVINIGDINKKSRDSQRTSDVKKIQTALELYFVDKRAYPASPTVAINGLNDKVTTSLVGSTGYIDNMPVDPIGQFFQYTSTLGKTYVIKVPVEFDTATNTCGTNPFVGYGCVLYNNPF